MSEPTWRVGRSQPINIYYGGEFVAVAFGSPAIAAAIVARMNEGKPVPPQVGVDWVAVEAALEEPFPVEHANALQGAFNVLLQRRVDAVDELEKWMRLAHDLSHEAEDSTFEECDGFCVQSRARLGELCGVGE